MEREAYDAIAVGDARHWWFVGRRAVLEEVIRRFARPPAGGRILDMGCASGGNLEMLSRFGSVTGIEHDETARAAARARGIAEIHPGSLPDGIGAVGGEFDLIALFDVLEHIEADTASLRTLGERLTPGGRIVLSVPAIPWLWSRHDEIHHHFRRYTKRSLQSTIEKAGLRCHAIGWLNSLLFPAAMIQRLILRLTGWGARLERMPPAWLNRGLREVFSAERHLIGRLPMPIGLSLWAVIGR